MGLKEDIFLPPGLFPSRSFRGRPPCAGRKEILFRLKRKSPPRLVGRREPAAGTGAAARSAAWEFLVGCYCCFGGGEGVQDSGLTEGVQWELSLLQLPPPRGPPSPGSLGSPSPGSLAPWRRVRDEKGARS